MKSQGMKHSKVFMLWLSLMLMTGIGAALGYLLGGALSHTFVVAIEGVAAGAMLTMIAAAMIPEAAHRGGPIASGVGTMLGFIAAISFKLLE
jgi:ZIP family zinc transporter